MVKIICEGVSDREFLCEVLEFKQIRFDKENGFLILSNKSHLNFKRSDISDSNKKQKVLEFENLKKKLIEGLFSRVLIVIDANDDYEKSKELAETFLEEFGFKDKGDIFIICDAITKKGYLESLLLSGIDDKTKECIEGFRGCAEKILVDKHLYHGIYKNYFPNKPRNLEHPVFADLINFLETNFKG